MINTSGNGSGKSRYIDKSVSGIDGLDEITKGGLPKNRATLICGGPGCGKTLVSMEFVANGITRYGDNGAYITFDESRHDLAENVASLGIDIEAMVGDKKLAVVEIPPQPKAAGEVGDYDLGGLLAMIGAAIDSVGAKRVVIDGIETLFSYFNNERIIRYELKKLIRWLKEKEVTLIITCERGEGEIFISRHGIEEYVSDCVILLDQRVVNQVSVRRLKIVKYRGAFHGTNEYPFLVTDRGVSIFPITSMLLDYDVSDERISTGVDGLDTMLSNEGYYKGSSVLISGEAGTGKSSLAAYFAASVCGQGKKCIYFAFEESPRQIIRNMRSIGLDLASHEDEGLLKFNAKRPTEYGIEMHLQNILDSIRSFRPDAVVFDPISNLTDIALIADIKSMFARILDHLKQLNITTVSTDLTHGSALSTVTEIGISSIMDTWIVIRYSQEGKRKKRLIDIAKSRGMSHVDTIHYFEITDNGLVIRQR